MRMEALNCWKAHVQIDIINVLMNEKEIFKLMGASVLKSWALIVNGPLGGL